MFYDLRNTLGTTLCLCYCFVMLWYHNLPLSLFKQKHLFSTSLTGQIALFPPVVLLRSRH